MPQAEFARLVGISPSHLNLILKGKRGASLDLAKRIEVETGRDIEAGQLAISTEPRRSAAE